MLVQPQRVSQRKKTKKSLGPDFLESSEMNIFVNLRTKKIKELSEDLKNGINCYICEKKFRINLNKDIINCYSCSRRTHFQCFNFVENSYINYFPVCNKCQEGICCKCGVMGATVCGTPNFVKNIDFFKILFRMNFSLSVEIVWDCIITDVSFQKINVSTVNQKES